MTVYLVGAGPGDPGLITVKGAGLLARAEVLVHDRLVSPELLNQVPDGCERISAAKLPRRPTMTQDEINGLLVERGRLGQLVVRLKGGDPCVFARGGEEARALAEAGIEFEELHLNRDYTDQTLRAVSSQISYPQVFIDGELIGGSDELANWLENRANSETRDAA